MENNQIDVKKLSVTELKALAYDMGVMINEYRNSLNMVNQEIIDRSRQSNLKVAKASETATDKQEG